MIDQNHAAAAKLRMPVLLLASPNDIISSADQIQRFFSQIRSEDKKLLWYTRSHHLILHDVQRAEALRDVERWLRSR
jgi:esterase/lipase